EPARPEAWRVSALAAVGARRASPPDPLRALVHLVRPRPRCKPRGVYVSQHRIREDTAMSWWNRSRRQDGTPYRDSGRARGPNRRRRLQLEGLEERMVLSTITLSEFFSGGAPVVRETINGATTDFVNPTAPFMVNTAVAGDTVNILDTSARIAITVNG